jgi:Domain of unknown function (DUF4145)
MKYVAPNLETAAFNCPHCHVLCPQEWYRILKDKDDNGNPSYAVRKTLPPKQQFYQSEMVRVPVGNAELHINLEGNLEGFRITQCTNPDCQKEAIWEGNRMIYPLVSPAPLAHEDMPKKVKDIYNKARNVFPISHESSSAMLRLALEELLMTIDNSSKSISEKIDRLIKKGQFPIEAIQAMDSIRVFGNEAVHPGKIQLDEPEEVALFLFELMNDIVEETISKPKRRNKYYRLIPESKRKVKVEDGN